MTSAAQDVPEVVDGERVVLLTRAGCTACAAAGRELDGLGVAWSALDVDDAAQRSVQGRELRAEHGDRLPVVMLDGREHSWGSVDGPRLRRDLGQSRRP